MKIKKKEDRELDLILFGATGFTGGLAAEYLAKNYGNTIKWAIAGRSKKKLLKIKEKLILIDNDLMDLPIIIADSYKIDQLANMAQNTRVICTTVGPFGKYGSNLVAICANFGTDYCDITGEIYWVRNMIEKYDVIAKEKRSKLISCSGFDCVPYDLVVQQLAMKMQQQEDTLSIVKLYNESETELSGGTLYTVFETIKKYTKKKSQLGYDPLMKLIGQEKKSLNNTRIILKKCISYDKLHGEWTLLSLGG